MDDHGFDALTRRIFTVTSRRSAVTSLAGLMMLLARWLTGRSTSAQRRPNLCRPLGQPCFPSRGIGCCGNATCRQGRCRCGKNQHACGSRCISKRRCCRHRDCGKGQRCRKGRCICPGAQRICGKRCVNLKTSKQHCGECGLACAGAAVCKQGVCVAGGDYRVVRQWGAPELNRPYGIAVDRAGTLFVAEDDRDGIIWKSTGDGALIKHFPAGGDFPLGIGLNQDGVLYVAINGDRFVQTFSRQGVPGFSFPTPEMPWGLDVSPTGDIYVANLLADTVQRFSASGDLIDTWDTGHGFRDLVWVAVAPNGDVYITDPIARQVVRFTATGVVKGRWGSSGVGAGQFEYPNGVTVDAAGFVYVADSINLNVQKFTARGDFVGVLGGASIFTEPVDVAVSRSGMVYVTDYTAGVIVQLAPA